MEIGFNNKAFLPYYLFFMSTDMITSWPTD